MTDDQTRQTDPLPGIAPAVLDAERRVAIDLPCLGCGYNVRTLANDAVCPECARPVIESLRGGFLRYADPSWVKGLGNGLSMVLIASTAGIMVPGIAMQIVTGAYAPGEARMIAGFITLLLAVSSSVLLAMVGLHWVTRRDPVADPQHEGWSARRMARWSSWLLLAGPLYWLALVISVFTNLGLGQSGSSQTLMFMPVYSLGEIAVMAAYCVTPVLLIRHLMVLLRRIPRPGLARFAQVAFWGLLVVSPLVVIGYAIRILAYMPMMAGAVAVFLPAPAPAIATVPPGNGIVVAVGGMLSGVGAVLVFHSTKILSVTSLALLLMPWLAFNGAARDAAACTVEAASIAPQPAVPPPSEGMGTV